MKINIRITSALFLLASFPAFTHDHDISGSDTSWILTSTALVLFMTIPGLSLFYAGLVRAKNVLSVLKCSVFYPHSIVGLYIANKNKRSHVP